MPFCDSAVAELALALPTSKKVRGLAKKRLLRRAVAPLLPRSIVRARKQGFSVPMAAWLRGELEPFARSWPPRPSGGTDTCVPIGCPDWSTRTSRAVRT